VLRRSVYEFPRKHLARVLYGEDTVKSVRKIDNYLDGVTRMPVDTFWTLCCLEPLIDPVRSLRSMYERYELAKWRRARRQRDDP